MQNEPFFFGLLAILGSLGVAVGDMFLLGNPVSGKRFAELRIENLLHVTSRNMFIGHTLGVLVVPLIFFGVFQVYRALEPAGIAYALPPVLAMAYMLVVGAAAHACFAHLGGAMQFKERSESTEDSAAVELVKQHQRLLYPLFGAFIATLIFSSLWFAVVVWTQPTAYPRWVALFNPFFLFVGLGALERFLPAPIGGYIRPANGNISFAVFFVISTAVLA